MYNKFEPQFQLGVLCDEKSRIKKQIIICLQKIVSLLIGQARDYVVGRVMAYPSIRSIVGLGERTTTFEMK